VDWTAVRGRLQQLGATRFSLERLSDGGYRFSCWLPRGADGTERMDGASATEAEAVRLCLEQAGRSGVASR
jgi:hypothetical protein